jgi:hypothetical protein
MIRCGPARKARGKNALAHKALAPITGPPAALYFGNPIAILQSNPPARLLVETGMERIFIHGTN